MHSIQLKMLNDFILDDFPQTAKRLNAAFYTRIFDAGIAEEASRQMRSPYFS